MAHSQPPQQQPVSPTPRFWSHPAHYHHDGEEEDTPHEPLLSNQPYRRAAAPPSSRYRGVRRSLIPWSPGQTIASETHHYSPSTVEYAYHEAHQIDDPQVEGVRNSCCLSCSCTGWLWRFCCGCCQSSEQEAHFGAVQHSRHDLHQPEPERRLNKNYCIKILYVLISLASFGGLYYYSSRFYHQQWTMNPGESRQVPTAGILTDSVQVVSLSASSRRRFQQDRNETISRGIAVYSMNNPNCPLLTGDPVKVDSPPQEIVLLHNAFQYQDFYLNKDSTMQVTVHQTSGACNILVLKGNKVLARIQNKKKNPLYREDGYDVISDLELSFSMDQVVLERVSIDDRAPIQFSFTSPSSDVYVLLFDNSATDSPAAFNVSYHMVLTTYDLEGLVPWCSHSAPLSPSTTEETSFTCPPLQVATAGCIIVEATEDNGSGRNGTVEVQFYRGDGVEVSLYTTRRWLYIGGLSILPSVLLGLIGWLRSRRRTRRHGEQPYQYEHEDSPCHNHSRSSRPGPNYHYLSHHNLDGGVREEAPENDELAVSAEADGIARGSSTLAAIGRDATSSSIEAQSTPEETTMIPAENVTVVK